MRMIETGFGAPKLLRYRNELGVFGQKVSIGFLTQGGQWLLPGARGWR